MGDYGFDTGVNAGTEQSEQSEQTRFYKPAVAQRYNATMVINALDSSEQVVQVANVDAHTVSALISDARVRINDPSTQNPPVLAISIVINALDNHDK